jgi:hypothetical protein
MIHEQKQKIIALRRDGAGYGQIAVAVGISINTVESFCRRHSLTVKTATVVGIGLIKILYRFFCKSSDKYPSRGYRVEGTNKKDLGKECEPE